MINRKVGIACTKILHFGVLYFTVSFYFESETLIQRCKLKTFDKCNQIDL